MKTHPLAGPQTDRTLMRAKEATLEETMRQSSAARNTLKAKMEGLHRLLSVCESSDFISVVEHLERCTRCVVSGMGKSGIAARKIAATFQSTGQRAAFLDPGAAAHGDLGMIEPNDSILMISNSGETDELQVVAHYASARRNKIILVTSRANSRLGQFAEGVLYIPPVAEGDPIGRVPMASTVCQIAVGDMLAAELMVRRGFTENAFLTLHHGGYLGRQMMALACLPTIQSNDLVKRMAGAERA